MITTGPITTAKAITSHQQDLPVVSCVDDVTVEEELELDVARVSLQALQDLATNGAKGVVGVSEDLQVINLTSLVREPAEVSFTWRVQVNCMT